MNGSSVLFGKHAESYNRWRVNLNVGNSPFLEPRAKKRGGGPRPMSTVERVARFTQKINPTDNDCWLWTGGTTADGYGVVACGRLADGRCVNDYAHRIVWCLTYGPIPNGLEVMHSCDTPACCNPTHLILGTHADNIHDAQRKNRLFTGKRRTPQRRRARLTTDEREQIRTLRAQGVTAREVAARFNVNLAHAIKIGTGAHKTTLELAREFDARHRRQSSGAA